MREALEDFWEYYCLPLLAVASWLIAFCFLIGLAALVAKWVWVSFL